MIDKIIEWIPVILTTIAGIVTTIVVPLIAAKNNNKTYGHKIDKGIDKISKQQLETTHELVKRITSLEKEIAILRGKRHED